MGKTTKIGIYGSRRGVPPTVLPPNSFLLRKPNQNGIPLPKNDNPELHYGQNIYLYNNIQTDQVVYSLTRHLNNKDALDQLPFLGKKTVPPRLRKDLWSPLAMVYFPSPHAGLAAYRNLREFRRLHETTYNLEDITEKEGKHAGSLYPTKKRGRILMNQKANSVADLAAVLIQQERGPSKGRIANAERRIEKIESLKRLKGDPRVKKQPLDVKRELEGVEGVCVRWANPLDAEYAETWPEGVLHDTLMKSRHTAAWPAIDPSLVEQAASVEGQSVVEMKEEEPGKKGWLQSVSSWRPWRTQSPAVVTA